MEYEDKICEFKKYIKQTMDLLEDAFKWKMMAKYSDDENMRQKYMQVSDTLFSMFMTEHNNIGSLFNILLFYHKYYNILLLHHHW